MSHIHFQVQQTFYKFTYTVADFSDGLFSKRDYNHGAYIKDGSSHHDVTDWFKDWRFQVSSLTFIYLVGFLQPEMEFKGWNWTRTQGHLPSLLGTSITHTCQ